MTGIKSVITLVSCENQKILHQRKYQIYPIITAVIIICAAAVSMIPKNIIGFTMSNYPYTVLSMLNYVFAPLAIFMLVSDIFSNEMSGNEIKVLLTRPVHRVSVLLAKVISVAVYIGIILIGCCVISSVLSLISTGFKWFNIVTVLLTYIIGYLPLLTFTMMSAMIACIVKSGTACFTFCILAYMVFMLVGLIFSKISPALFTYYLGIGGMMSGGHVPFANLFVGIAVLIGYALIFLSVSGIKFMSKDF
ncbi:MAG: ABC transporter permease [Oscillospiraceae bacterium]|nr:ABC transporter permease [Oscillospiraceae bacterium]